MSSSTAAVALRSVGPADGDFLFRVYASTREEELAPIPWTEDQKRAFLLQQFGAQSADWSQNCPGPDFQIIEVDGTPAGRFYLDRGPEEIRLVDIALLPEYRRAGIGAALIRGLLAEATKAGLPVTLHVEVFNPARRLYERLGFEAVEDRGVYVLMRWLPRAAERQIS